MHKNHTHTTHILFTQSGELLQDNSYYPFGMLMSGLDYTSGTSPENKYLYNGKELQDDFEQERAKFQISKKQITNKHQIRMFKKSNTRLANVCRKFKQRVFGILNLRIGACLLFGI